MSVHVQGSRAQFHGVDGPYLEVEEGVGDEVAGVAGVGGGGAGEHRVGHRPRGAVGAALPFLREPNQNSSEHPSASPKVKTHTTHSLEGSRLLTSSMGRRWKGRLP